MIEKLDIITIGESLVELSCDQSLQFCEKFDKFYGGDSLCTAVTAKKLGSQVGYITRVGNDHFREFLLDCWQSIGLDISNVKLVEGYNGLYFIARPKGEDKEFAYYRKKTAACSLSIKDISEDYIKEAKVLYTTGIAQSISLSAREAVCEAYKIARRNGLITAYDPNYTPKIQSVEDAKEVFEEVADYIDILFLSLKNDAERLFGITSVDSLIKHLWDREIGTVIVKSSHDGGYFVGHSGDITFTKFYNRGEITDTTGSGDAFNGGYLHSVTSGMTAIEAAKLASVVAGLQSKKMGAIKSIPAKSEVYECYKGWDE